MKKPALMPPCGMRTGFLMKNLRAARGISGGVAQDIFFVVSVASVF